MSNHITERQFEIRIAKEMGVTVEEATKFSEAMERVVNLAHENNEAIRIRGLGHFKQVTLKPRRFRNLHTGAVGLTTAKRTIRFSLSKKIERKLNENFPPDATPVEGAL